MTSGAPTFPLITRHPSEIIARLERPSSLDDGGPTSVSVREFWAHVIGVAQRLPEARCAINMCESRYVFLVSFCALLLRGQTNVLPPNASKATLTSLVKKHQGYLLTDKLSDDADIVLDRALLDQPASHKLHNSGLDIEIPARLMAAICYTSGSTGSAKPIEKPWSTLYRSSLINSANYLRNLDPPVNVLATVSSKHMWGLETTILMALHCDIAISEARPLFPADIRTQLEALPSPRLLVSTPTHLRAVSLNKGPLPEVKRTLCATAPLHPALAHNIEQTTGGDLVEIYGCSEMGSMAWRRPALGEHWHLFDGFSLTEDAASGVIISRAEHISEATPLGDIIELESERTFKIRGRKEDLINIAGKRGSLSELNNLLDLCPGVLDGVIFSPAATNESERLAAMLVLDSRTDKKTVVEYLRARIDPVFIPRPILLVDELPRNENSKLSMSSVRDLFSELLTERHSRHPAAGND